MLKHGLIADHKHWNDLISIKHLNAENLFPFIETSMKIKERIVGQDFKEQHIRKTLNFGHTIGHAIESLFLQTGTGIPHGEAVALGMICESRLAFLINLIGEVDAENIINNIRKFYPYLSISQFPDDQILHLMMNDKKNSSGKISFSLLKKIGEGNFDCEVSEKDLISTLQYYRNLN